ncbi:MAG: hypothetical protein OXI76_10405 [Gemmatimonadota bacterium]|nr:hypothetical protein [Gemmatimonadota bacterium]
MPARIHPPTAGRTVNSSRAALLGRVALPLAALVAAAGPAARAGTASQPLSPDGALSTQVGAGVLWSVFTSGVGLAAIDATPAHGSGGVAPRNAGLARAGFAGSARPIGQGEAFLSSLLLPGLSQYRQGRRHWIAYAGIEVLFVALYLDARSDTRGLRNAYRDFAWTRARIGISTQPRSDGDFEYYERLSKWAASGAWDVDPLRDGLQPEPDPATYNGSVWALAAEIYNLDASNPERSTGYARAVEYYRQRGYGPSLLWKWDANTGDRDHFLTMIMDTDRRARDTRRALWIVTANHLLSAIDGFITARLATVPPAGGLGLVVTVPVP